MEFKLTHEQTAALRQNPTGVYFIDPTTERAYVLVAAETHEKAIQALHRENDLTAIREGLAGMDQGTGIPVELADARMRAKLGFPASTEQ